MSRRWKGVIPLNRGDRARQSILQVPEHRTTKIDIVSHQSHSGISRPALLVSVADDILKVRIWLLGQESLDQILRLFSTESEEHPDPVNVSGVQTNGMSRLCFAITELQEVVRALRWTSKLRSTLKTEQKQVNDQAIVLEDKAGKLQTSDHTVAVGMVHVFVVELNVVLRGDVVSQIVIHDETEQTIEQSQIHLLVDFRQLGLDHDVAFAFCTLPHICQVVDALSPFVDRRGGTSESDGLTQDGNRCRVSA